MCGACESWSSAVVHVKLQRSEIAVNYGRTGLNVKWIDARTEHVVAQIDVSFHSYCRVEVQTKNGWFQLLHTKTMKGGRPYLMWKP